MKLTIDSIISQTLTDTVDEQPAQIADRVMQQIKPNDYGMYLRQLILSRLSSVAGRVRERACKPAVSETRSVVSVKQRMIREEYWPRFLASRVAVPGGWKSMGELTVAELDWLADLRRAQAADLVGKAVRFERLAGLMREAGVAVLGELSRGDGEAAIAA